ncbi:MAG TPA: cupin domain-containing protein [Kutzneria sp.]|jgi:mannose-6-phosphate isomerase-like protein (cupin superfamily)
MSTWPEFPGAVGISDLSAYPWPTVDNEHGGSPHMHLACTEAYVVVGGRGRLQTLDHSGPNVHPLAPGDVVWFTPGTIHRAINDGGLHVIVIMQNGGLPEAGDAVMTFPHEHLTPERYPAAASTLGPDGRPSEERARARRDLAVEGFTELVRQWRLGNRDVLDQFHRQAAVLVAPRLSEWRKLVENGAAATAAAAIEHVNALGRADTTHLTDAGVHRIPALSETTLGMCGHLRAFDPVRRLGDDS